MRRNDDASTTVDDVVARLVRRFHERDLLLYYEVKLFQSDCNECWEDRSITKQRLS